MKSTAKPPKQTTKAYRYKATNARGQIAQGVIEATNPALAKALLIKQGLRGIQLKPVNKRLATWQKPIPAKQILLALRTLATLTKSGIVLTQALGIAAKSTAHPALAKTLTQLKTDIESGQSLTQAMRAHPKVFHSLSLALIDAGEQSGALDEMLERLAEHYEDQDKLKNQVKKALRYPIAVVVVAVVVMVILLVKVVPTFAQTFASMDTPLPLPTQLVVGASNFLVDQALWLLLGLVVITAASASALYRSPSLRHRLMAWALTLPVLGPLLTATACARFAKTLSTTFGAGVALPEAIDLSAKATDNSVFIQAAFAIKSQIQAGNRLQDAIARTGLFSLMSLQMIGVGEESGRLVEMLDKVASYHEQEVHAKTEAFTQLLEPAIMVVLGLLVGGLVVAMYLPILTLGANV